MNDKYYKAGDDTYTFIDTLETHIDQISKSGVILEVGCGNGEISNFLRIHCKHSLIISSDINIDALVHTQKMARTECVKSSLLRCFNQKYIDTVIFNPPYVETENDEIGYSDIRASYSGGIAGRVVIEELIDSLTDVRNVYLLVIKKNDPDYIIQKFVEKGYSAKFVKIRKILAETLYIIKAVKK